MQRRPRLRPVIAGHARLGTAAAVGAETGGGGGETALVTVQSVPHSRPSWWLTLSV